MLNPASYLDASARRCPAATAVVYRGRRYSYAEIAELANRTAAGLRAQGLGRGDRIALCCGNRPGYLAAYYGILKAGAAVVVLSSALKPHTLAEELRDAGAAALLAGDGTGDHPDAALAAAAAAGCARVWLIPRDPWRDTASDAAPALCHLMADPARREPSAPVAPDETLLVVYTSGTSGRPKGVEISAAALAAMVQINLMLTERAATRVRLTSAPLHHITGQVFSLNLAVLCGDTMVLLETFDPVEAWRLIVAEGINHLVMMPICYKWLLDHANAADASRIGRSLRLCGTGGGPLPGAWYDAFRARFGLPLVPGYGMTETAGMIAWHCPAEEVRPSTVGRPVPGVSLRLRDEAGAPVGAGAPGRIEVRSPGTMTGYLGRPEATAQVLRDGWLLTGDVGRLDEDGYLTLIGRETGKIIRGAEHVYPTEIECVLQRHPAVAEAAVVAIPDVKLGQEIKAIVVPKADCRLAEAELRHWLMGELPDDKCPGIIQLRDSLPLTDSGKPARHELG